MMRNPSIGLSLHSLKINLLRISRLKIPLMSDINCYKLLYIKETVAAEYIFGETFCFQVE